MSQFSAKRILIVGVSILLISPLCMLGQATSASSSASVAPTSNSSTITTSMVVAPAKPAANPHSHNAPASPAATQQKQQGPNLIRRGGMKMHVQKWATLPTGSTNPAVTPLDPNTVPKFVNQLTRPATFVPIGTKFDPTIGRSVPLYQQHQAGFQIRRSLVKP